MSAGVFAWPVESEPSWPVVIAWSMSSASPERHSPTMIRSGRMCRALRSRSRIVISPWPSRFGGRASSLTTCAWRSCSSAASSIVTIRSSSGMNDDRTLRVGGLARAGAARDEDVEAGLDAGAQELEHLRRRRPERDQVVDRDRLGRELPDGDDRPDQRQRLDDRVDARAVGQPRVDARARCVDPPTERGDDPVDDPEDVLVVQEVVVDAVDLARPLDVEVARAVDHDLGDRLVEEERIERPEAADLADQLVDQALAFVMGHARRPAPGSPGRRSPRPCPGARSRRSRSSSVSKAPMTSSWRRSLMLSSSSSRAAILAALGGSGGGATTGASAVGSSASCWARSTRLSSDTCRSPPACDWTLDGCRLAARLRWRADGCRSAARIPPRRKKRPSQGRIGAARQPFVDSDQRRRDRVRSGTDGATGLLDCRSREREPAGRRPEPWSESLEVHL